MQDSLAEMGTGAVLGKSLERDLSVKDCADA